MEEIPCHLNMFELSKEDAKFFLDNQLKLFKEPVAETYEDALEFLEEVCAVVCKDKKELKKYLEEECIDTEGMSLEEILEQPEVFALSKGRYLFVEG